MKIWTNEHTFNHSWQTIAQSQWRKYPNPHNTAVLGTDVLERYVSSDGKLHSHRIITSDWGLAPWVQTLIGGNKETHGYEYSVVDPLAKTMELTSTNLTFCNFVSMKERMKYSQHPEDPNKTLMTSEMVVTVRNVPLTTYMEDIVLSTVSKNSGKGRIAMEYVVDKVKNETRPISDYLDKLKLDVIDLKHLVSESVIKTAQVSIDELQKKIKANIEPEIKSIASVIEPEIKSIASVATEVVKNSEPVLNVRAEINPSRSIL